MPTLEEFWNQVHPSRLTPRPKPKSEPAPDLPHHPPPEPDNILTRSIRILERTPTIYSVNELTAAKAFLCLYLSRRLLLEDANNTVIESQAVDFMHMPTNAILRTYYRLPR